MKPLSSNLFRAALVALALPLLGVSAAVQINSTCVGPGSCSIPANLTDSVQFNAPVSGSTSNNITIGTDTYSVSTTFNTSYDANGSALSFIPTVTYTGSVPATSNDTITINFFQDIYDNSPGTFDGAYTETIPLSIPVDTTVTGQLFVDGQGLPLVGPYGPGYYSVQNTENLTGLTGDYLAYDYQFVFNFAAGLPPGSTASAPSSVPEPAQTIPAALGLIGLGLVARRQYNKQ